MTSDERRSEMKSSKKGTTAIRTVSLNFGKTETLENFVPRLVEANNDASLVVIEEGRGSKRKTRMTSRSLVMERME